MKIGFMLPVMGAMATQENMVAMAQLAEARGFESVWVPDHVIMPTRIVSTYPYTKSGGFIADPKGSHLDPITSLAFVAGCTKRVRLGFSVLVAPYRHPVVTGKMMATIDVLSNGWLDVGVGAGWLNEEFEALGVPTEKNGRARKNIFGFGKNYGLRKSPNMTVNIIASPPCNAAPSHCRSHIRRSPLAATERPALGG